MSVGAGLRVSRHLRGGVRVFSMPGEHPDVANLAETPVFLYPVHYRGGVIVGGLMSPAAARLPDYVLDVIEAAVLSANQDSPLLVDGKKRRKRPRSQLRVQVRQAAVTLADGEGVDRRRRP